MVGSFGVTDENGKKMYLFYTGQDFSKLMPGEIYNDHNFNEYIITSVDYQGNSGMPSNIRVMELLKSRKQNACLCLDSTNINSVYSVAQLEELLLPLGFKIVFK